MAHIKLTPEVRAILERSTITSSTLTLPQQLPRNLYDAVMKVLKNCGGEWKRGPQCHVFSGDPRAKLGLTFTTGVSTDLKKAFQFFPTPPELAASVAIRAHVRGCSVLEPSAGHGALVKACTQEGRHPRRHGRTQPRKPPLLARRTRQTPPEGLAANHRIHCADFLTFTPDNAPIGFRCLFERIVMNPPFNKGQDLKHIVHAVTHWLKPGGTLTAIVLPHPNDNISAALGDADDLCSWTTEDIDAGAFKASGTNIRTSLLLLEKSATEAVVTAPIVPFIPPPNDMEEWLSDLPLFTL